MIVPGLIEAHMHPQITGILWQGVYVGRFDRTAPDGTLVNGLDTKEAVVERLKDAAAKLPADGRWLVGWGYQPEFYGESPLTRADLDPSFGGVKFVVDGSIQATPGCFSGRATTRLSPTESRTSPKTTSPSGSPRCTSAGSKP